MISDKRIKERIDIDETERRSEEAGEKEGGRQRRACSGSEFPEQREHREHTDRKQPLPPHLRVDSPPRINKRQLLWPDEFEQVKPKISSGDQTSIEDRQVKRGAFS